MIRWWGGETGGGETVAAHTLFAHIAAALDRAAALDEADPRSRTDSLTGLLNRDGLARRLSDLDSSFAVGVIDLDHFKQVNDEHGHEAGDQVLVRVANLLLSVVRHSDVVARTGGEEFVLLMPRTDLAAAVSCCERALSAIRGASWSDIAPGLRVTASVGIAGADEGGEFDAIASLADSRLYAAKRAGRDRVIWA